MALFDSKLFLAAAIFAAGWIPGLLPLRYAAGTPATWLGYATAAAAGLILGTGLLHMLPEANESWTEIYPGFPVAFVLAAAAFLLLLLLEHVVLARRGHTHGEVVHGQHELAAELGVHAREKHFSAYLLLAGLSIHSLLEGLALGAQRSAAPATALFVAVLAHKLTDGFALGVNLTRFHAAPTRARNLVTAFSLTTPLGIGVGAVASSALGGSHAAVFDATMTALAGGTFIYIAGLEIISEEFSHGTHAVANWCFASAGLAVTALLALWL
jgi:zinc transporter ZupT